MKTRIILYADKDKVLTDGEIYGKQIFLDEGKDPTEFKEISDNEYETMIKEGLINDK